MSAFSVPIALIIFNRPDTTAHVVEALQAIQPTTLFIIADGPRSEIAGEVERCRATRAVVETVDWNGDVHTNYASKNLGCQRRIASGINWVFEQVDRAIILEDDCVPHESFFPFCEQLLKKYEEDERVMSISGDNFQPEHPSTNTSYYFSRIMHCWGWATWRRAWRHFDLSMQAWPQLRNTEWLTHLHGSRRAAIYWKRIFDHVHQGQIDSWAYVWQFNIWTQHGLNIHPAHNLVSNVGFGNDATHTSHASSPWANLPTGEMTFPMRHPSLMIPDIGADAYTQRAMFDGGWLRTLARSMYTRAQALLSS